MESESTKERSPEAIALRAFKVETIQKMLDANAYFPQTHSCMRLVAAIRYLDGLSQGYTYNNLYLGPEDFVQNNNEFGRMVAERLAKEHKAFGRNIRITRNQIPSSDATRGLGGWYASIHNDGVNIVEHIRGLLFERGVSSEPGLEVAHTIIIEAKNVLQEPVFEEAIRRFREDTEARDEVQMRKILEELEKEHTLRISRIAGISPYAVQKISQRIFAPQRVPWKDSYK